VNPQLLHDAVKGRKPLPAGAAWNICRYLAPIVIKGWLLEYLEEDGVFYVSKKAAGADGQAVEYSDPQTGGTWFEYPIREYRDIIPDEWDLVELLS